jgi:hypothetical protein
MCLDELVSLSKVCISITTLYLELTKTYHRHENNRNHSLIQMPSPQNHLLHHRRQIEESSLYHLSKGLEKYVPPTNVSDPEWPVELEGQE